MVGCDLTIAHLRHRQSTTTDPVNFTNHFLHPLSFHSSSIQNTAGLLNSNIQFDSPSLSSENKYINYTPDILDASLIDIQSLGSVPTLISSDSFSTSLITPFDYSVWTEPNDKPISEYCSASKFRDFYSYSPDKVMAVSQTESLDSAQHKSQSYPRSPSRPFSASLQPGRSQFCHPRRRRFVSAERLPELSHVRSVQSSSPSLADESAERSKHLPTPNDTPTHESFFAKSNRSFNSCNSDAESRMSAEVPSRPVLRVQNSVDEDDVPSFTHSGRHSVSSYEQTPTTPRTAYGDDAMDGKARYAVNNGKALISDGAVNYSSLNSMYWWSDC